MRNALLGLAALTTVSSGCATTNSQRTSERPVATASAQSECFNNTRPVEAPIHPDFPTLTARACLGNEYPDVEAMRNECRGKAGHVFFLHSYNDDAAIEAHWECGPKR